MPVAALWIVHLILVPFYLLPSGLPQPADGVGMVFAIVTFTTVGLPVSSRVDFGRFAIAIWYIVTVGFLSALLGQDALLLMYPAFFLFNAAALCAVVAQIQTARADFLRLTFWGMSASVGLQALLMPFAPNTGEARGTLFFNNPNQLGYYALTAACILAVSVLRTRAQRFMQPIALGCCAMLAVHSLSKAAMAAIVCLLALVIARRRGFWTVAAIGLAGALVVSNVDELTERVYSRIVTRESDESLSARGYDRMFVHSEYLLFGAGEGRTERFETGFKGEIHSTFATMLFSYGVIGAGLTAWFFWGFVRKRPLATASGLLPLAVYGATHNGLRSTLAWEYVGILACVVGAGGLRVALPGGRRASRESLRARHQLPVRDMGGPP